MARITLPPDLVRLLREHGGMAKLCDEAGTVVAEAIPAGGFIMEPLSPELSDEEFERLKKEGKWYRTTELIDRLRGR